MGIERKKFFVLLTVLIIIIVSLLGIILFMNVDRIVTIITVSNHYQGPILAEIEIIVYENRDKERQIYVESRNEIISQDGCKEFIFNLEKYVGYVYGISVEITDERTRTLSDRYGTCCTVIDSNGFGFHRDYTENLRIYGSYPNLTIM